MSNLYRVLSSKTLIRAAALKKRIEGLSHDLELILGGADAGKSSKAKAAPTSEQKPKRKMSKAGRARIAEAARKRWAKVKAAGKNAL
jgi:hypothetical protein